GIGAQSLTVGNKLVQNSGELNDMIGNLWARLNSEWDHFNVTLSDGYLDHIDPTEYLWVTASELAEKYKPQRKLSFFDGSSRFLPLEVNLSFRYDITGVIGSLQITLERETEGIDAVELTEDDI